MMFLFWILVYLGGVVVAALITAFLNSKGKDYDVGLCCLSWALVGAYILLAVIYCLFEVASEIYIWFYSFFDKRK